MKAATTFNIAIGILIVSLLLSPSLAAGMSTQTSLVQDDNLPRRLLIAAGRAAEQVALLQDHDDAAAPDPVRVLMKLAAEGVPGDVSLGGYYGYGGYGDQVVVA